MAQKQTAFVVVSKDWIDTGVRYMLNGGNMSRSTTGTHLVIGEVDDASDQRGLWLKKVTTTKLTKDGSPVTMKFMIPWSFIFGCGLADDEEDKPKPGFPTGGTLIWEEPQ
jgi:hypothetical protein